MSSWHTWLHGTVGVLGVQEGLTKRSANVLKLTRRTEPPITKHHSFALTHLQSYSALSVNMSNPIRIALIGGCLGGMYFAVTLEVWLAGIT